MANLYTRARERIHSKIDAASQDKLLNIVLFADGFALAWALWFVRYYWLLDSKLGVLINGIQLGVVLMCLLDVVRTLRRMKREDAEDDREYESADK